MDATPAAVARTSVRRPATPGTSPVGGPTPTPDRRRGDLVTIDPEDRRRRARAALLDLAIEQALRRSR